MSQAQGPKSRPTERLEYSNSDEAQRFWKQLREMGDPRECKAQTFGYEKVTSEVVRKPVPLCRTPNLVGMVQIMKPKGGEPRLHYHDHLDGFWFVLKGRVRFYTAGDALVGEFGPHQGVLIPRKFKYWFENAGEDDLEILLVEVRDAAELDPGKFLTPDWYAPAQGDTAKA